MTYTRIISANGFATGLSTLAYGVKDSSGTVKIARTTTGVSEVGNGTYKAAPTFDTTWGYVIVTWDDGTNFATETIDAALSPPDYWKVGAFTETGNFAGNVGGVNGNIGGDLIGDVLGNIGNVSIATGGIDSASFASGTTIPRVTLADTVTTYTGNTPQTGDSFARIGAAGVGLTNLGDVRIAHLNVDVSSRLASGSNVTIGAYAAGQDPATLLLAASVDGVVLSTMLTNLNAFAKGKVSVVNNGNGTYLLTFKKEDNASTAFTRTYAPSTGART